MTEHGLIGLGGAAWRDDEAQATDREAEDKAEPTPGRGPTPVNIRNFSVKCGYCGNYQTIVSFRQLDEEWNEYVYECEQPPCSEDAERSRTVLEIPADLDEFARRDPAWRGGAKHAGAEPTTK